MTSVIDVQGSEDVWTRDVLNLGVSPDMLITKVTQRLKELGGVILDNTSVTGITVHPDGVCMTTGTDSITTKLTVDCMGHASPIVRQIRCDMGR